jgi:hypothetical protein
MGPFLSGMEAMMVSASDEYRMSAVLMKYAKA